MSNKMRSGSGRSVVGVCVAAALLFGVAASPASAEDNPNDTWVRGVLKGEEIVIQEQGEKEAVVFPLGEKGEASQCNPEEKRSQFKAFVDDEKVVSGLDFNFAPGTIEDVPFITYVCALIEVKNNPGASMDDKLIFIKDPGANISVTFYRDNLIFFPNFSCRLELGQVGLNGQFSEPKPPSTHPEKDPWDWNLTLENNEKVTVPQVQPSPTCSSSTAGLINEQLGLDNEEDREADATFKWIVYDEGHTEPVLKP